MLTLNETFGIPDADHAWTVINDLETLVPCVPGARVMSADSAHAVKARIEVRMGAMGMTFTGAVKITSADAASRTVTIRADTRETLGQSYATGDITICVGDGEGTIDAVANVGGKAAGMGEGVIVNVLTDLVRSFSANVATTVSDRARRPQTTPREPEPEERDRGAADAVQAIAPGAAPSATTSGGAEPGAIFQSLTRRFGGRLDVKLTSGPDDAPLLKSAGKGFAMLHGGELAVRLHPGRCAELVDAGKGRLFVSGGETHQEWLVVAGIDAAEWTAHTMEALGCTQD